MFLKFLKIVDVGTQLIKSAVKNGIFKFGAIFDFEQKSLIFRAFLAQNNESSNEYIVAIESYTFGLAPRITGFCFLSSHGRIFKMENKNTQVLGESITLVGKISDHHDFISLSRIAYGEDIKQYFVAATKSGMVFTTDDLKTWKSQGNISLK